MSVGNVIDSLFVKLGFQIQQGGLDKFEKQVHGVHGAMKALGLVAGYQALKHVGAFIERSVSGAAHINTFAATVGMAATEVAAFDLVAIKNNASVEGMRAAIAGVSRATGAAAANFPRYATLFASVGLKARDSADHVKSTARMMSELGVKFAGMDINTRNAVAGRLGIDPEVARLMATKGSALAAAVMGERKNGVLTDRDFEQAEETKDAFELLGYTVSALTTKIAVGLGPWITKLLASFDEWQRKNMSAMVEKATKAFDTLSRVLRTVWNVGSDLVSMGSNLVAWLNRSTAGALALKIAVGGIVAYKLGAWGLSAEKGLLAVGKSMLGMKGNALIIGAAMAALILVVQDLYVWSKGGKSVIGAVYEKWPTIFKVAAGAVGLLTAAFVAMKIQALAALAASKSVATSVAPDGVVEGGKIGRALSGVGKAVAGAGIGYAAGTGVGLLSTAVGGTNTAWGDAGAAIAGSFGQIIGGPLGGMLGGIIGKSFVETGMSLRELWKTPSATVSGSDKWAQAGTDPIKIKALLDEARAGALEQNERNRITRAMPPAAGSSGGAGGNVNINGPISVTAAPGREKHVLDEIQRKARVAERRTRARNATTPVKY